MLKRNAAINLLFRFIILCLPLGLSPLVLASAKKGNDIDRTFEFFLTDYYVNLAETSQPGYKEAFSSVRDLANKVNQDQKLGATQDAILSIIKNKDLLEQNVQDEEIVEILSFLLDQDLYPFANTIINKVLAQADKKTKSRLNYQLAVYYSKHQDQEQSFQSLANINYPRALNTFERDYARILYGKALQEQKDHRKAIEIYDQIKPGSHYYTHAKLNQAIAQIRQGWWTDAKISIDSALEQPILKGQEEITNRLLVVLGYAQFQHGFYRNARDTFRKVNIESQYVNRAMLGIALAALNQDDNLGASRILARLQQQSSQELPVMESFLLLPLTEQNMEDLAAAVEGYEYAQVYFTEQVQILNNDLITLRKNKLIDVDNEWYKQLPKITQENYSKLTNLDTSGVKLELRQRQQKILDTYSQQILSDMENQIKNKLDIVESYLSQSQYGLANLYDATQ